MRKWPSSTAKWSKKILNTRLLIKPTSTLSGKETSRNSRQPFKFTRKRKKKIELPQVRRPTKEVAVTEKEVPTRNEL